MGTAVTGKGPGIRGDPLESYLEKLRGKIAQSVRCRIELRRKRFQNNRSLSDWRQIVGQRYESGRNKISTRACTRKWSYLLYYTQSQDPSKRGKQAVADKISTVWHMIRPQIDAHSVERAWRWVFSLTRRCKN
jgi:hypothetical protein